MRILSNSAKFSAGRHLLPAYNFSATMTTTYSTYRFGAVANSKIFGDWKYASPLLGPRLLWPNGWMDQDTIWYGGMPRPRRHLVRWTPTFPTERGTAAPDFRPTVLARIPAGPHFTHKPIYIVD